MGIWRSPLHGMYHLQEHSLLWNDKVNAGEKPPECIACPDNNRDQPANEHRNSMVIPNYLY